MMLDRARALSAPLALATWLVGCVHNGASMGYSGATRLVAVPVCRGKMTVVAIIADNRAFAWESERRFFQGLQVRDDSPACRWATSLPE